MKRILLVIAVICCLPACSIFAQSVSKAEFYGGYQLLHDSGMNVNGFLVGIEGNLNKSLGVVGEFGYARKGISSFGVDVTATGVTFLAGPRLSYRADKFRVFGEFLAGLNHAKGTVSGFGSSSANGFAIAIGGGLDFAVTPSINIRPVQFDWMDTHISGGWGSNIRYSAGVVFKFGGDR
jgi:opacity protein-like surface antigen